MDLHGSWYIKFPKFRSTAVCMHTCTVCVHTFEYVHVCDVAHTVGACVHVHTHCTFFIIIILYYLARYNYLIVNLGRFQLWRRFRVFLVKLMQKMIVKIIRGQILPEKMWSGIPKFPYIVFKVYVENGLNSHWYLTRVASNARLGLSIFSKLLYFCMYFCM